MPSAKLLAAPLISTFLGIVRRLLASGCRGILVPSFAPGATPDDHNLVLWQWSEARPCPVRVHDPSGRLLRDQLSWR